MKYYEEGNKQGFAGIVPFDINHGWYAHIEEKDYMKSGAPTAFWICNVWSDGLNSEGVSGGDVCQYFQNSVRSQKFILCPEENAERLYDKAQKAIMAANKNGKGLYVDGVFIGFLSFCCI